eukprot:jgi/Tetstr1/450015/TSEL_037062.t1
MDSMAGAVARSAAAARPQRAQPPRNAAAASARRVLLAATPRRSPPFTGARGPAAETTRWPSLRRGRRRADPTGSGETTTVECSKLAGSEGDSKPESADNSQPGASNPIPEVSRPHKAVVEVSQYGRTQSEKMMEFLSTVTMEVMETYEGAEGTPLKFEPAKHRPINWRRSATHAASSLLVVALCQFVLVQQSHRIAGAAFVAAMTWIWEVGRRRSETFNKAMVTVFKAIGMQKIFHPEEWTKVTSWTWYVTSLLFLCFLPYLPAAYAGLVVLGFGDPAAGMVGRRWGTTSVPGAGKKTFEGAIAFILAGCAASTAVLWMIFGKQLGLNGAILLSSAAAVGGCIGELYHDSLWKGVDDNFSVPVLGALTALLMANGAGFISVLPRFFS